MAAAAASPPWLDTLSACISEVVAMRAPDPMRSLALMLADPGRRPDWAESADGYASRHKLGERITQGLEDAGIVPSQPEPPDALARLSAALLAIDSTAPPPKPVAAPSGLDEAAAGLKTALAASKAVAESLGYAERLDQLQAFVSATTEVTKLAVDEVMKLQKANLSRASTRSGFLRALSELIGPRPEHDWQTEWKPALKEAVSLDKAIAKKEQPSDKDAPIVRQVLEKNGLTIALQLCPHKLKKADQEKLKSWTREASEVFECVSNVLDPAIGKALREQSPRFAAATYKLCEALVTTARTQSEERRRKERELPPLLYMNRSGWYSLELNEPAWLDIEQPDRNGFYGLTSSACHRFYCDHEAFAEEGFLKKGRDPKDKQVKYMPQDSDVICVESQEEDAGGFHHAIMMREGQNSGSGCFPPNTLYRLVRVDPPGTWLAPNGVRPQRRLLVVHATYKEQRDAKSMNPRTWKAMHEWMKALKERISGPEGGHKMAQPSFLLQYSERSMYAKGLDEELLSMPVLTLEKEMTREMAWTDWKKISYTLVSEWNYVLNRAGDSRYASRDVGAGKRDEGKHEGWTKEQFLQDTNDYIRKKRAELKSKNRVMTPDEAAELTMEELLAVRLYSGPVYQLINGFLRQIARLTGETRRLVVRDPQTTFAATVGALYRAVRKLAAVETVETKLYRGVRGELPDSFYKRDPQGMIAVVDDAFMSTSKNQQTPVDYMGQGANVLWELHARPESDVAYHYGADISQISQFGHESEVLFPPFTMLVVQESKGGSFNNSRSRGGSLAEDEAAAAKKAAAKKAAAAAQRQRTVSAPPTAKFKAAQESVENLQQQDLMAGDWQAERAKARVRASAKLGFRQESATKMDREWDHTKLATDNYAQAKAAGIVEEEEFVETAGRVGRNSVSEDVTEHRHVGGKSEKVSYQRIRVMPCFI